MNVCVSDYKIKTLLTFVQKIKNNIEYKINNKEILNQ